MISRLFAAWPVVFMCLTCSLQSAAQEAPTKEPSARQLARLEWNHATLVGDYDRVGLKDPRWDEQARAALAAFAKIRCLADGRTENAGKAKLATTRAMESGCKDPLVRYLHLRFVGLPTDASSKETVEEWRSLSASILGAKYSAVRQYYICLRAAQAMQQVIPPLTGDMDRYMATALEKLEELARETGVPDEEMYEAGYEYWRVHRQLFQKHYEGWQKVDAVWQRHCPDSFASNLLKGLVHVTYAWDARTSAPANAVTSEGWQLFGERLAVAHEALEAAWKLRPDNATAPTHMIRVALGQSKDRNFMETWFQRAMGVDPNNAEACAYKLMYLEPKWYGSTQDMLAFGRVCAGTKEWGGTVPLFLVDAHENVRTYSRMGKAYFKESGVWTDLKGAYESYFPRNPDDHHRRTWYAYYAFNCEQWKAADQIITALGTNVHTDVFGGEEGFKSAHRQIIEHVTGKAPAAEAPSPTGGALPPKFIALVLVSFAVGVGTTFLFLRRK